MFRGLRGGRDVYSYEDEIGARVAWPPSIDFKTLLQTTGNEAKLEDILKCVRAQLKVPLIQGCLQYAYKTDDRSKFPGDSSSAARKGELWAFCSGVLPFLHDVSSADAEALRREADIMPLDDINPDFAKIKAVFTAENLNKMGVKCSDVGGFVDKSSAKTSATTLGSDFAKCSDGTLSNAVADSSKCAAYATASSAMRTVTGGGLCFVLAAVVAALGVTM